MESNWTSTGKEEIESWIQSKIDNLISTLVEKLNPTSIIIHGSFSHSEGSVCIIDNNFIVLGDFDISFLSKTSYSIKKIKEISNKLSNEFGFPVNIYQNNAKRYLNPDPKNPRHRIDKPSIETYSRKYGSKVIYGKDYLSLLPEIDSKLIRNWEAQRLIFNRMGECLKFSTLYKKKSNKNFNLLQTYELYKLVISTLEAFLVINKLYHFSHIKQLKIWQDSSDIFKEILEIVPSYNNLIEEAVNFKLNPSVPCDNIDKLHEEVITVSDIAFRYIVEKLFGFQFDTYLDFQRKYMFHKDLVKYYNGPISSRFYQNTILLFNFLSNKKYFPSKLISNFNHHLNHLIICTVVIAFIDCSRIRCVNRESLNLVLHNLLYFFPLRIKNKENKISVITDKTHELWTLAYV